jgi:hypothetical protein
MLPCIARSMSAVGRLLHFRAAPPRSSAWPALAVAALRHLRGDPRGLHRLRPRGSCAPSMVGDGALADHAATGVDARAHRLAVDAHRAGAALAPRRSRTWCRSAAAGRAGPRAAACRRPRRRAAPSRSLGADESWLPFVGWLDKEKELPGSGALPEGVTCGPRHRRPRSRTARPPIRRTRAPWRSGAGWAGRRCAAGSAAGPSRQHRHQLARWPAGRLDAERADLPMPRPASTRRSTRWPRSPPAGSGR